MSYEGYTQHICQNGHRFDSQDVWHAYDCGQQITCTICGIESAISNDVDKTNHDDYGFITDDDWRKFLISEQVIQFCNFNCPHITQPAIYKIPSPDELEKFRTLITNFVNNSPIRQYIKTINN